MAWHERCVAIAYGPEPPCGNATSPLFLYTAYAKERTMADIPTRRQSVRLERTAYHEAGHAVAAASFGCRFGMLSLYPDAAAETALTGPLQIDLPRCAFPPNQPNRLLQVLTILWAGTAAETQLTGRRIAPEADPDRKTV